MFFTLILILRIMVMVVVILYFIVTTFYYYYNNSCLTRPCLNWCPYTGEITLDIFGKKWNYFHHHCYSYIHSFHHFINSNWMSSTCLVLCSMLFLIQFSIRWIFSQMMFFHSKDMDSINWHLGSAPDSQWEQRLHNNSGLETISKLEFPGSEVTVKFWWILQISINR